MPAMAISRPATNSRDHRMTCAARPILRAAPPARPLRRQTPGSPVAETVIDHQKGKVKCNQAKAS